MQKKKLPAKTTIKLLDSTALMNLQYGIAFNSMVTFNFRQAGLTSQSEISNVVTSLNKAISRRFRAFDEDWQLNGAHPYCYIYVHEYVESKGHHLHQLVAMHDGLHAKFDSFLSMWAERNLPPAAEPNALHYRGLDFPSYKTRAENQAHLVRYVIKATDDACFEDRNGEPKRMRSMLGLEDRRRYYVADVDRPAGTSQNLSRAAQMMAQKTCRFEYNSIDRLLSDDNLALFEWRKSSRIFAENLSRIDI